MKCIYNLRIDSNGDPFRITQILKIEPSTADNQIWDYEVVELENDDHYDFINKFLDILDGHYSDLEKIGVSTEDITIWFNYAYNQQCNMEFSPKRLKRLGDAGITLCISCWEE